MATADDDRDTLTQRAQATILQPLHFLTSRPAIKAYLGTLLFLTASLVLISISTTAYFFFYYHYIPQINLERVIHLQYGPEPSVFPHATTPLETSALISQQAYDISLEIHMPRTPSNLAAGNFMLDLILLAPGTDATSNLIEQIDINIPASISSLLPNISSVTKSAYRSRRPAILPYHSQLLSLSSKFLHLPFHLLGFRDLDATRLSVPMFERVTFPRGARNVPTHAKLEIQSGQTLQIYEVKINFHARFSGLRYLIYNHRVSAFLVFTALFYGVSISTMAVAWGAIAMLLNGSSPSGALTKVKKEDRDTSDTVGADGKRIKSETHDEGNLTNSSGAGAISDTPTTFPVWGRTQPQLVMTPKPEFPDPVSDLLENVQRHQLLQGEKDEGVAADDEDEEEDEKRVKKEDDEDEEDEASYLALQRERERQRRKKEREEIGDSGIGTGIESENVTAGLQGAGVGNSGTGSATPAGTGREVKDSSRPGTESVIGLTRRRSGKRS